MYRLLLLFAAALTIASCSDDMEPSSDTTPTSYMPLQTGNYWVYQVDRINPDGTITATDDLDSIHVLSNTFSDGIEYHSVLFMQESLGNQQIIKLIRDSLGYLVTSDHEILFSPEDDDAVLHRFEEMHPNGDLLFAIDRRMVDIGATTSTPAGTFTTRNAAGFFTPGPVLDTDCNLTQDRRYAEGIGLVELTDFFATSCHVIRRQLLRYNIEE